MFRETELYMYSTPVLSIELWLFDLKSKVFFFFFSFISSSLALQKMVLVLNGVLQDDCPMDTVSLFMQHPVYRDYANQLLSIPTKTVSDFFFFLVLIDRFDHISVNAFDAFLFICFFIVFYLFVSIKKKNTKQTGWSDWSIVCWSTWNGSGGHTR